MHLKKLPILFLVAVSNVSLIYAQVAGERPAGPADADVQQNLILRDSAIELATDAGKRSSELSGIRERLEVRLEASVVLSGSVQSVWRGKLSRSKEKEFFDALEVGR